jgi:hypothetical protein
MECRAVVEYSGINKKWLNDLNEKREKEKEAAEPETKGDKKKKGLVFQLEHFEIGSFLVNINSPSFKFIQFSVNFFKCCFLVPDVLRLNRSVPIAVMENCSFGPSSFGQRTKVKLCFSNVKNVHTDSPRIPDNFDILSVF